MRQRVKPWTRWHGGILVPSMSGVGTVTLPVPDAPVIAADTLSSSSIEITLVSGEGDVFQIERSLNGSDWTQITADANFPYAATGLSASTLYYFRARAQFTGGPWSEWSESVSGTTEAASGNDHQHGDLVTITGSGFGASMPSFQFAGGDDGILETTTLGQVPNGGTNVDGGPSSSTGFNWTRFRNTVPYAPVINDGTRGKCIGLTTTGTGESSQEVRFPENVPAGGRLMIKYWARYAWAGNSDPAQFKFARVQGGTSDMSDTNQNMVFTNLAGGSMAYCNSAGGVGADTWYLPSGPVAGGVWQRVELKIIPSAQGSHNGQVYYRSISSSVPGYISGTAAGSGRQLQSQVQNYANSNRYRAFTWQNWWGNGRSNAVFAIDDHFAQIGSFACVELWNSLTPSSATQRQSQKPTAWSANSITVRLNRGGLSNGTYYLVALDDSVADTVLASREITLTS